MFFGKCEKLRPMAQDLLFTFLLYNDSCAYKLSVFGFYGKSWDFLLLCFSSCKCPFSYEQKGIVTQPTAVLHFITNAPVRRDRQQGHSEQTLSFLIAIMFVKIIGYYKKMLPVRKDVMKFPGSSLVCLSQKKVPLLRSVWRASLSLGRSGGGV